MASFYKYTLKRNNCFISPNEWFSKNAISGGMLDTFNYGGLIGYYDNLFGKENVLVCEERRNV